MPWPVYTERFMHHSAAGSYQWTVPAGKRAIIKYIGSTTSGENYNLVGWQLSIAGMFAAGFFFQAPQLGNNQELMAVAYEGEVIRLYTYGTSIHVHVAGWLMQEKEDLTAELLPVPPEPPELPPLIPWPEDP